MAVPLSAPSSGGPLVAVCLRYTDLRPAVDPLTGAVTRDRHSAGISAADAAALEHAFRIADAWSGRVLAVTAGPAAADAVLRDAAALGASVLRVDLPDAEPAAYLADLAADPTALAAALAAAVRSAGEPALVLCGDRSSDRGTGAVPALLAHILGAAQALGLVDLRATGAADPRATGAGLVGERRLDGGRRERLAIPRPAVCSVEAAGVRLRRAPLPAVLAAERLSVPVLPAPARPSGVIPSDVIPSGGVTVGAARPYRPRPRVVEPPSGTALERLRVLTGALVAHDPPTIIGPVSAAEAADALLAFLERNGYGLGTGQPDPVPAEPDPVPAPPPFNRS